MWFRTRRDPRVRDEIRFHRDRLIEQYVDAGLDRREAERRAFLELGNPMQIEEAVRDVRGRWLDDLWRDTRFALRVLWRSPAFTLTAVVTLAVGIGVNAGMFSLVNGFLLRPLVDRSMEIVSVYSRSTAPASGGRLLSYADYEVLRDGTTEAFASLAAYSLATVGLDDGDGPRRTLAAAVTADYFETLGGLPVVGRPFTADEGRPGAAIPVAIVSHGFWARRGADPGMVGRVVRVNGEPFTVIGVAPEGFSGTAVPGPELWLPLGGYGTFRGSTPLEADGLASGDVREFTVVARLRPGHSVETAKLALTTIARQLEQAFPAINAGYTFEAAAPSRLLFVPGAGRALVATVALLLMLMPGVVLLVACLNLANLLLARGHTRRQELAIRSALGGGRWRLTRQLITEGLLLALAGGAVGLLLSAWATDALLSSVRPVLPLELSLPDLDPDWRVFVGTVAFSIIATMIFGAFPAWALTGRAVATDLKRQSAEEWHRRPGGIRVGNALVITQVALSVLLVAVGGLFLMSALSAGTADPGFQLDGGLLVEVDPGLAGYDEARGRQMQRDLVDRLRAIPGLESVAIGSGVPFSGFNDSRLVAPAAAAGAQRATVDAVFNTVGRDYARTLGLPMLAGRDFNDAELVPGASEPVAIVDDALARRLWPGEDALGRQIQFLDADGPDAGRAMRVVGIVPAVKHSLGNPHPFPHVYVPLGQHAASAMTVLLRVADREAAEAMRAAVADIIRGVDARLPVLRLETWQEHLDASLDVWIYRAGARLCAAFAGIALLLAIAGVYGVKSYVVSHRTREFGIRIATGADPRALLWQVLREGGRVTAIGVGLGLLLALGAGRLLQGFLYGVDAVEPLVLLTAPLILIMASLLASAMPAYRATRVDPAVVLRSE